MTEEQLLEALLRKHEATSDWPAESIYSRAYKYINYLGGLCESRNAEINRLRGEMLGSHDALDDAGVLDVDEDDGLPLTMSDRIRQLAHAARDADYLVQRISEKDEVFAEIRRTVGGNVSGEVPLEEPDPEAPWLPVGLMLKIEEAMEGVNRA